MVKLSIQVHPETAICEQHHITHFLQRSALRAQSYGRVGDIVAAYENDALVIALAKHIPLPRANEIVANIIDALQRSIAHQPTLALRIGISGETPEAEVLEREWQQYLPETAWFAPVLTPDALNTEAVPQP